MQLLHGSLSRGTVRFSPAPRCAQVENMSTPIQDMAMHGCNGSDGSCNAMILPRRGQRLLSCPLRQEAPRQRPSRRPTASVEVDSAADEEHIVASFLQTNIVINQELEQSDDRGIHIPAALNQHAPSNRTLELAQSWLSDRGGIPLDDDDNDMSLLYPEELSSIAVAPCKVGQTGGVGGECIVVGTNARRIMRLAEHPRTGIWAPRGLIHQGDDREDPVVPSSGTLALIGSRFLGMLDQPSNIFRAMDMQKGGVEVGSWRLPSHNPVAMGKWAAVCAAGDNLYALEDTEDPHLWRFRLPSHLTK